MLNDKIRIFLAINVIIFTLVLSAGTRQNSTLKLVHIIFRHGDRTTDKLTLYPKDPYINETYYPYGLGELTNKGKQREYKLGKILRHRYGQFLGDLYTPDMLEAYSSDANRTKMSLQLVLAGLFPPVGQQIWESGLNWQPIPYNTLPANLDQLFYGIRCPNFQKLLNQVVTSEKYQQEIKKYQRVFDYICENTGIQVKSYWDAFFNYMCLTTEEEFGLRLPDWTKLVYPDILKNFALKSYGLLTSTTDLRRLLSGNLLRKIFEDTQAKIHQEPQRANRTIYLYSGHDFNIALLLQTMDVDYTQSPPYGAYLALELHKIDNIYGFKIYYKTDGEPELLKLPACDAFCPLDKFTKLLEEYLPEGDLCIDA